MFYNFCRTGNTLRVTPVVPAGLTTRLCTIDDLVAIVEVREAPTPDTGELLVG